jgi:hypothetical protein
MPSPKQTGAICQACLDNKHEECCQGDCGCPEYQQRKNIEREIDAVNQADSAYAEAVLSNLQYSGSALAKLVIDGAGRDQARAFVHQVMVIAKALRC